VCVCVCVSSIVVYRKSPYTHIPIPLPRNRQTLSLKHTHPYPGGGCARARRRVLDPSGNLPERRWVKVVGCICVCILLYYRERVATDILQNSNFYLLPPHTNTQVPPIIHTYTHTHMQTPLSRRSGIEALGICLLLVSLARERGPLF